MAPPLSVIKIVKYCCVWGGGRQNPTKDNGALSHCIKIDKYCGTRGREGIGGGGGRQNPTKIMASLISVIKIIKYFGIVGGALGGGALK